MVVFTPWWVWPATIRSTSSFTSRASFAASFLTMSSGSVTSVLPSQPGLGSGRHWSVPRCPTMTTVRMPNFSSLATHDLKPTVAQIGTDPELLVHDGPDRAVGAPRLEHHRPLVERTVDGTPVIRRRRYLGHRAWLLVGIWELQLGIGRGEPLLLADAEAYVVAFAYGHDGRVQ